MALNTTPRTWAPGEVVTAALLNQEIRDALTGIQSAWPSYSVVWTATGTNPVLGNGTLTAVAQQIGKTYFWRIALNIGSTTTVGTGSWIFTMPAAAVAGARSPMGDWVAFDTSASTIRMGLCDSSTGGATVLGMDFSNARLGAASPFTWATGDSVTLKGTFEST